MRRIRPTNPEGKPFTADQEARIKQADILFTSARILELGVSNFLNRADEYMNDSEMATATQILNTACTERKQSRMLRDAVRKEQSDAGETDGRPNPAPRIARRRK